MTANCTTHAKDKVREFNDAVKLTSLVSLSGLENEVT